MLNSRVYKHYSFRLFVGLVFLFYILAHLLTLQFHPFVHSDEAWLASLSRAMVQEQSLSAVEDSFRFTDRYPHALKTLYHLIQIPFISVSWSAFAARIPSLMAGILSLFILVKLAESLGLKKPMVYLPALLVAADPQFWYLSHLARQEMILILLFLLSWYFKVKKKPGWQVALPLVAGIFIHPNTFILAAGIGSLYLGVLFYPSGKETMNPMKAGEGLIALLSFCLTLALGAGLAVGLSYIMDSRFLFHYLNFGDSVGAGDTMAVKILGMPLFLKKMYLRHAGTYFLADVRFFYTAALAGGLMSIPALVSRKPGRTDLAVILPVIPSMLVGMVLVGKYGPPTIGFLLVPSYILFTVAASRLIISNHRSGKTGFFLLSAILVPVIAFSSFTEIRKSSHEVSYQDYQFFLDSNIGNEGRVLVNMNAAFVYEYDRLVIWRDLAALPPEASLKEVLTELDVRWIVLPEELELIYRSRPVWNRVYGNPSWYPELLEMIETSGTLVAESTVPVYAMRIVPFMDRKAWTLKIYRIQ